MLAALLALAAALPWFGPDWVHTDVLAAWLYLALSATGLALTAGWRVCRRLPRAFMSVGCSRPRPRGPGGLVGLGAILLPSPRLCSRSPAASCSSACHPLPRGTWLVAWLVLLVAIEFPAWRRLAGLHCASDLSATGHHELALALTVLLSRPSRCSGGRGSASACARSATVRWARALGVRSRRLLLGALRLGGRHHA